MNLTPHKPGTRYTLDLWMRVKRDFVTGKGSLVELSEKYGMSYPTVLTVSAEQKWGKLRTKWVESKTEQLLEETKPEPIPDPNEAQGRVKDKISTLRTQVDMIDRSLEAAFLARDIADLVKAKSVLEDLLFIAEHGMKPGTMKPARQKQRGSNASPIPIPEPLPMVVDDNSQAA
jgi:hypothetical protein